MPFSFSEWYRVNGERLNKKRRERYHTDPEYKARVLKTNQESRQDRKKEPPGVKESTTTVVSGKSRQWKAAATDVDGKIQDCFTIGAVADILGCSIQVIRLWEKNGTIPATPIRGNGEPGDRLYTIAMIDGIKSVLSSRAKDGKRRPRQVVNAKPWKRYVRLSTGRVKTVDLYLVGALAEALSRNVAAIEQLENKGLLPRTPFRTPSVGRRLYTEGMIAAVKAALATRGGIIKGDLAGKEFYRDVLNKWEEEGVVNAVLIETLPGKVEYNEEDTRV